MEKQVLRYTVSKGLAKEVRSCPGNRPEQGDTAHERKENQMRRQRVKSRKKTGKEKGWTFAGKEPMPQATKPLSSAQSGTFRENKCHQTNHVPSVGTEERRRRVAEDLSPFSGSHTGQEAKIGAALGPEKQSRWPRGRGEQRRAGGRRQGGARGGGCQERGDLAGERVWLRAGEVRRERGTSCPSMGLVQRRGPLLPPPPWASLPSLRIRRPPAHQGLRP